MYTGTTLKGVSKVCLFKQLYTCTHTCIIEEEVIDWRGSEGDRRN